MPVFGGVVLLWGLVHSVIDLSNPANSTSVSDWFGFGPPVVIAARRP